MSDFRVKYIYFLAALLFLTGLGLLAWSGWNFFASRIGTNMIEDSTNNKQEDCQYRRILDGVCVQSASGVNPRLVGVMIENHVEARPQSGLEAASIVYEAPVEANYTRFLAIYPADVAVAKVGPVRSARSYHLDWLSEYGSALYMHCGGSPEALDLLNDYQINDLNEFYRGQYFWRDLARSAPHNVYTSADLWQKALYDYRDNYLADKFAGWKFATTTAKEIEKLRNSETIDDITVSFLSPNYVAEWKYNTSTNQYLRGEWVADDVIVQYVKTRVLDEIGRLEMDTVGSGEAVVFHDGLDFIGTWVKNSRDGRTRFYDLNGEEMELKPGRIWIEVANQNTKVSYE